VLILNSPEKQTASMYLGALQCAADARAALPYAGGCVLSVCGLLGRRLHDGKIVETDEDFVMGSLEHAGVAMERLRRYCNQLQ
jgi:hypothetical protein